MASFKANFHVRCWHFDPDFGKTIECAATSTSEDLEADFFDQENKIEVEQDAVGDNPRSAALWVARYFMYRRYVDFNYGVLGQENRVQIPKCVVECIGFRFRKPRCVCQPEGALYECKQYVGHKKAEAGAGGRVMGGGGDE